MKSLRLITQGVGMSIKALKDYLLPEDTWAHRSKEN